MDPQGRTAEQVLAAIAGGAHGVAARPELLAAGVTSDQIKHRLRTGSLIREYRGVYRVGHRAPSTKAGYLAAVRACGPGSVLCGRAAGHLLGLVKGPAPTPEVITPTERRIDGIVTRRARRGRPVEATMFDGIPVTTVARTLVDLAGVLRHGELARACHEAGVRYGTTPSDVARVLERRPNAPGAGRLRAVMSGDARVTLSRLEREFLRLLASAGLELPETNRVAGGRRVDCRWPDRHLTVELDGYRFHNSRHAWEQDRRREREARGRGDEFRRFTWSDVVEDPRYLLRELRALLDHRRRPA